MLSYDLYRGKCDLAYLRLRRAGPTQVNRRRERLHAHGSHAWGAARACLRHVCTPAAAGPRRAAHQGQSLVELALLLPILLLVLLGAVNLGMILHTDTELAQITQQAASYLLAHPADATSQVPGSTAHCGDSTAEYAYCTDLVAANYLSARGYSCQPLDTTSSCSVQVRIGLTSDEVQLDTLTVSEPGSLIVPYPSWLHVGSLSATASTIASAAVWSSVQVSGTTIQWQWMFPFAADQQFPIQYQLEEDTTTKQSITLDTSSAGQTATIACPNSQCPSQFHLTLWQANDMQTTCTYANPPSTSSTALVPTTCRYGP